jgi:hypothetical protein
MVTLKPLPKPRPRPLPSPKIMRLPRGKRLTIAAGFPCKDGLVICADTQETIPGYVKTDTEKMRVIQSPLFNMVFAGAGDSDLIEMTVQEMDIALTRDKVSAEWDIRKTLKTVLLDVFHNHILPDPDILPEDRPELLIALQYDAATLLYKTKGTKFRQLYSAECVGRGVILAKSLTAQLFDSGMPLSQGSLVALYVLRQTKRWVDGCGGNSDVLLLSDRNRAIERISTADVTTLESHFDEFNGCIYPLLIATADRLASDAEFKEVMRQFGIQMLGLRGKFMEFEEFYRRLCEVAGVPWVPISSEPSTPNPTQS